jgi:hypothetical protein
MEEAIDYQNGSSATGHEDRRALAVGLKHGHMKIGGRLLGRTTHRERGGGLGRTTHREKGRSPPRSYKDKNPHRLGVWAVVLAAADLLATRWERVGQVILAGVRSPSGVSHSGGHERLSAWGWHEDGGGGGRSPSLQMGARGVGRARRSALPQRREKFRLGWPGEVE